MRAVSCSKTEVFAEESLYFDGQYLKLAVCRLNCETGPVQLVETSLTLRRAIKVISDFQIIDSEEKFDLLLKYKDKLCKYVTVFDMHTADDIILEPKHIHLLKNMWPRLKSLSLACISNFSSTQLYNLLSHCKGLESFAIFRSHVFNVEHLLWLERPSLKSLSIDMCRNLIGLEKHISHFKGLEQLTLLHHPDYPREALFDPRLKHLCFEAPNLICVNRVEVFPKLESIDLSYIECFSLEDLETLLTAIGSTLQHLILGRKEQFGIRDFITDTYVDLIAKHCPNLISFDLSSCRKVSNTAIEAIDFSSMQHFTAQHCQEIKNFNFLMAAQKTLIALNLCGTYHLEKGAYESFLKFRFPNLIELNLSGIFRGYEDRPSILITNFLMSLEQLRILDLSSSNIKMAVFLGHKMPSSLRRVSLHACNSFTKEVIDSFDMDKMEKLDIRAINYPLYLARDHFHADKLRYEE